ncbi:MAG: hypothetical protein LDLANPLL_02047 [Turneriella sp.]|nr:hypothetical protein [Turneriella sp.]
MAETKTSLFAIVGAGPSLDLCKNEINSLIKRGAIFLVSDSVSAAFSKYFPLAEIKIFTVEMRRHLYLVRLPNAAKKNTKVFAYNSSTRRNLTGINPTNIEYFCLQGENGNLPALYSPGTVLGVMLSYALQRILPQGEIHLMGADFSYLDQRVYTRFIIPHAPLTSRLFTYELWQLEMVFKKTSQVLVKQGIAVRTSFEFLAARENIRRFVERVREDVHLVEYSPVGIGLPCVEKRIPVSALVDEGEGKLL